MKYLLLSGTLLAAGGLLAACHPDAPATATSPRSGDADYPSAYDTLHVAGGGVLHLTPITAAAFFHVPEDTVFVSTDYEATLTANTAPVSRYYAELILQPAQGPAITFRNQQKEEGSSLLSTHTYYYRGPLPGTHQWLVDIHELHDVYLGLSERHHSYYCLIDQRTGQRTDLVGFPAVSPDGRYLACTASGLYEDQGLEGPSGLQLFRLGAGAPRQCWLRNPQHWGPAAIRWAGSRTMVLQQARLLPSGKDAPFHYVEVALPF